MKPRLIQTFLPDGSLEGVKVIVLSESSIKAFVVPRIKLNDLKQRSEISQPSLYLLINSADNQLYIGESENFFHRVKNHDQSKAFWDLAIAIVSSTNSLEKSDVKYLESLAVERAQTTAAMEVLNKTIPSRNNVHEFKVHTLEKILEDTAMIAESLGFSIFSSKKDSIAETWFCISKKTNAKAQFRGDQFVVLAGSVIDKRTTKSWNIGSPDEVAVRQEIMRKFAEDNGETFTLIENVPFKSPNKAGRIIKGQSVNAWLTWKNEQGQTMDEVMRQN